MRSVGVVKPRVWHTRESHRARLDAESAASKRRREREQAQREAELAAVTSTSGD